MKRRGFLKLGLGLSGIIASGKAPAIIKVENLMTPRNIELPEAKEIITPGDMGDGWESFEDLAGNALQDNLTSLRESVLNTAYGQDYFEDERDRRLEMIARRHEKAVQKMNEEHRAIKVGKEWYVFSEKRTWAKKSGIALGETTWTTEN